MQKIIKDKNNSIFTDSEFAVYLDDLFRKIRLNVIKQKVLPYKSVKLEFLAQEVNASVDQVK